MTREQRKYDFSCIFFLLCNVFGGRYKNNQKCSVCKQASISINERDYGWSSFAENKT